MRAWAILAAVLAFGVSTARADEVDPASLYDLQIKATPKVHAGKSGEVTVRIEPHTGAEIHKEAPAKLQLSASDNLNLPKATLGHDDMKLDGGVASFDASFTAVSKGKGSIDAKLSFYICTEKTCAPQTRTVTLPVTVR